MKRGNSNSLLMELLIVTLFFALASSVLVELFAAAGRQNRRAEHLNAAQAAAQDTADLLYAAADPEESLAEQGFERDGEIWLRTAGDLTVEAAVSEENAGAGVMRRAEVRVTGDGETLISLPVSRYVSGEAIR